MADIGFFLASLSSTSALMEAFGLNAKVIPRSPTDYPGLPSFFSPSDEEPDEVGKRCELYHSVKDALTLVRGSSSGGRNLVLAFDETVTFPGYAMLSDARGAFYIGGADGKARLSVDDVQPRDLRKSDLAQTTMFYLLRPGCALNPKP